jgi:TRAP-type C4-dicarboxylate transport system substrate-binding protein
MTAVLRYFVIAATLVAGSARPSANEPGRVLKMGTTVPDGTLWAHELKRFAETIEQRTAGRVRVKWYFGGITGDELEERDRILRGELDGAGWSIGCSHVAQSLRVGRLPAVFLSRDEATDVLNHLQPLFEKEAHEKGLVFIGSVALGQDVLFTRKPVKNLDELKRLRLWRWSTDGVANAASREMGFQIVELPISEAARAYDEGRVDGFFVVPSGALSWQFSVRARYLVDLPSNVISGCLVMAERSLLSLSLADQAVVRDAGAVVRERVGVVTRDLDDKLMHGLFAKQGVVRVPISEDFRAQFFAAARLARDRVAESTVSKPLLDRVLKMVGDFRGEHSTEAAAP